MPLNEHPSSALLRDHFWQCIFANLKTVAHPRQDRRFDPEIGLFNGGFDSVTNFGRLRRARSSSAQRCELMLLTLERGSYEVGV